MRKLLDGTEVPEFDMRLELKVNTKCPQKYKLVDLETGQEYIGQVWTKDNPYFWKNIDEDQRGENMYEIIYTPRIHDEVAVARFETEPEANQYMEKLKEVRPKAYPYHRIEAVQQGETV